MSKNRIILIIGVLSVLMPFLGFPSRWKSFFFFAFGAVLVAISLSISLRRRRGTQVNAEGGARDLPYADAHVNADRTPEDPPYDREA